MKLICVPGYPSGARSWDLLIALAPAGWDCAVVPLPDGPETTLGDQEAAIVRAVEQAGDRVTLLGHSLGAYLVARVLPRLGERVRQAVLIGGFAAMTPALTTAVKGLVDNLESGALGGEALRQVVHDVMVQGEPATPEAIALLEELFLGPPARDLTRMFRRQLPASLPENAVAPYDTPTLVVHGTEDRSVAFALGEELARLGTRATLVPLRGAGHFVQLFHTRRLAESVFR